MSKKRLSSFIFITGSTNGKITNPASRVKKPVTGISLAKNMLAPITMITDKR